jgi:ELWxxDGT repeat protein
LVEVNGSVFFGATTDEHGTSLWKSDGTPQGTVRVKDIGFFSFPQFAGQTAVNIAGTLFFTTSAPSSGFELWKSDGTEAGTVLVKDILPAGVFGGQYGPRSLTNVGGVLYFVATTVRLTFVFATGRRMVRFVSDTTGRQPARPIRRTACISRPRLAGWNCRVTAPMNDCGRRY